MTKFSPRATARATRLRIHREPSFRDEIAARVTFLETDALPRPIDASWTQGALATALRATDHIPDAPQWYRREFPTVARVRPPNWDPAHGLRVFGWTTGHGLPWALAALDAPRPPVPTPPPVAAPRPRVPARREP